MTCHFHSGQCPYITPCKVCPVSPAMSQEQRERVVDQQRLVPRYGSMDDGRPDETLVEETELARDLDAALQESGVDWTDTTPRPGERIVAPPYREGGMLVDITSQLERVAGEPHRDAPINGHNCAVGACPFVGECGPVDLDLIAGTGGCLASCIWGAAAQGDAECIERVLREHPDSFGPIADKVVPLQNNPKPLLSTDRQERKDTPIYSGVLTYFPRAIAYVSKISRVGNDIWNPGEPMHWAKGKSQDHGNCVARHLIESGTWDHSVDPPVRHSGYLAWRALALLDNEIEADELGISVEELKRMYREGEL